MEESLEAIPKNILKNLTHMLYLLERNLRPRQTSMMKLYCQDRYLDFDLVQNMTLLITVLKYFPRFKTLERQEVIKNVNYNFMNYISSSIFNGFIKWWTRNHDQVFYFMKYGINNAKYSRMDQAKFVEESL